MQVFYVYNETSDSDQMVLPEKDCMRPVDRSAIEMFISVKPDFSQWHGQSLDGRSPESIGRIVASRSEDGDVCINDLPFWQEKMAYYLSSR